MKKQPQPIIYHYKLERPLDVMEKMVHHIEAKGFGVHQFTFTFNKEDSEWNNLTAEPKGE